MAKAGSEKKPLIMRVQTERRMREVAAICSDNDWYYIMGLEPDKPEDISDLERLLNPRPTAKLLPTPGRNDPCPCGSGKKYKRCCGINA